MQQIFSFLGCFGHLKTKILRFIYHLMIFQSEFSHAEGAALMHIFEKKNEIFIVPFKTKIAHHVMVKRALHCASICYMMKLWTCLSLDRPLLGLRVGKVAKNIFD